MDAASLPVWAQSAGIFAIALVSAILGVFRYLKTESKTETTASSVISASFIDSKLLKELIEAIREFQEESSRDTKKSHRLSQDLKESINTLNEAIIMQTDTNMNLIRFLTREANKSKMLEKE